MTDIHSQSDQSSANPNDWKIGDRVRLGETAAWAAGRWGHICREPEVGKNIYVMLDGGGDIYPARAEELNRTR